MLQEHRMEEAVRTKEEYCKGDCQSAETFANSIAAVCMPM